MGEWHIGETCNTCGGKVMKIMWGMPLFDGTNEADREGWYIGGCCIDERVSRCECGATSYDHDGQLVDVGTRW